MSSGDAEHEMVRGGFFRVVFARNSEGAEPAADFLAEARGDRHARSCKKLLVTITRFASCQPGTFRDPQRFKPVEDGILEFRADQLRLLCGYDGKGRLLLLCGVVKKKDDLRPEDVARATRILHEHRAWRR